MAAVLTIQPAQIEITAVGEDGCLIFADDRLVAVLVHLSDRSRSARQELRQSFTQIDPAPDQAANRHHKEFVRH